MNMVAFMIMLTNKLFGAFHPAVSVRYSLKFGAAVEAAAVHAAVCLELMDILVNTISTLFVQLHKV
jgi:hypothetical protein